MFLDLTWYDSTIVSALVVPIPEQIYLQLQSREYDALSAILAPKKHYSVSYASPSMVKSDTSKSSVTWKEGEKWFIARNLMI